MTVTPLFFSMTMPQLGHLFFTSILDYSLVSWARVSEPEIGFPLAWLDERWEEGSTMVWMRAVLWFGGGKVCGEKTASQDLERFGTAEFTHTHTVTGGSCFMDFPL
jgi:hypothetical protein